MSTTLFFLVPIGMLAVVWSLCFVGACFNTSGIPGPGYSGDVLSDPNLIAYWPLNDLIGPPLNMPSQTNGATDLSGNHHDGTYKIPPAYPPPTPATPSMQITNPSVGRGTSIVPGDSGSTKNPLSASADFDGGYVSIPWAATSPMLSDFTVEAWIQPHWTVTGFRWTVFSALGPGNTAGFVIYVNETNQWQFFIGDGTATNMPINSVVSVDLTVPTYVAVTFDSSTQTLSLWINPQSTSDLPNPPPPMPTFTQQTTYVAVDPSQMVTFFIGADANEQALRTQDGGAGAPLFPFVGQIQSVALYGKALDASTLQAHFMDGAG